MSLGILSFTKLLWKSKSCSQGQSAQRFPLKITKPEPKPKLRTTNKIIIRYNLKLPFDPINLSIVLNHGRVK